MSSSEFRAEARNKLEGKWGKAALISLAYAVVFFVISLIQGLFPKDSAIYGIISIAVAIIEIPLGFGLIISFLKLFKGEDVKAFDFLQAGFSNFKKAWGVTLQTIVKMLPPVILMVVSIIIIVIGISIAYASTITSVSVGLGGVLVVIGTILIIASYIWLIPRSYFYQLAYIIAADNETLTSKESVLKSKELMSGNRWKLFCLQFSFIGWVILASITLGIGFLWLIPYMQFAMIAFYMFLIGTTSNVQAEVVTESNDDSSNDPIQGE